MFSKCYRLVQRVCTIIVFAGTIAFIFAIHTRAATPGIINYQGRVQVGGVDFNSAGKFYFALVDGTGVLGSLWTNDNSHLGVGGTQPTTPVTINVSKGLYSVILGNTDGTVGPIMTAISPSVFGNSDVRLRIWFDDGTNGPQQLAPDQKIASVGYALVAAAVDDGSVTTAKLAPGSVTAAKVASFPKCRCYNDADQLIPNLTNYVISFDQNRYDTDGIHSTSGTRLTCNTAGVYHIFGSAVFGNVSSGTGLLEIRLNGVTGAIIAGILIPANGGPMLNAVSTDFKLNAGDYVELILSQNSGSTVTLFQSNATENEKTEFGMSYLP